MAVSRAQIGRTWPPASYVPAGRLVSAAEGAHRDPAPVSRAMHRSGSIISETGVGIEGTDSGRIRVVRATDSGTNCLRRARLFITSRNREQPIRMVTRSVIPSETAKYAAPKLALNDKPGARLDGYQMLWWWARLESNQRPADYES